MIGKIDIEKSLLNAPNDRSLFVAVASVVNSLVDAVNGILDYAPLKMGMKAEPEPADPYAEQRKWIGCVCRFWDFISETPKHFGILTSFDETATVRYEADNGFWYYNCEPVKPDDDIIYKGGDNE